MKDVLHVRLRGDICLDPQPGAQLLETAFCGKQEVRTEEAEHHDEDGRNLNGFQTSQTIHQDSQQDSLLACETDGGERSHQSRAAQVLAFANAIREGTTHEQRHPSS